MNRQQHKPSAYFIGIKGVGMTMLAQFLQKSGWEVSGSDIVDTFLTDKVLAGAGIKVFSPFAVGNLPAQTDLIVFSSAYNSENNPELRFISNNSKHFKNVKILNYAAALGEVFNRYQGVAVCGSHGKTTTAAWLGYVLKQAGLNPNVLVGSRVPQFKGSSLQGGSHYLVAEADEYQNKLRYFRPRGVVLNNIDYDHPDWFANLTAYRRVFKDFIKRLPAKGFLVYNADDAETTKIIRFCPAKLISYRLVSGDFGSGADYLAYDLKNQGTYQVFKVSYQGQDLGEFKIGLWGRHNVLNALAVIATAHRLKVSWFDIKKYLRIFKGTERRAQVLGQYRSATIIDDYAHHPTEIQATLQALRNHFSDQKLIAVFHPHTFTRTKALLADFARSFLLADELVVLDIYASAREKQGGISSRDLVAAIKEFNKEQKYHQIVRYLPTFSKVLTYLESHLNKKDVLVLLGAGDVFRVGQRLLSKNNRHIKK